MQVKVFKFDKNGRVSFTQAELEKLLNEIYTGGYNDGRNSREYWTWTSPYYTWTHNWTETTSTPTWTVSTATPTITWTSTNTKNGTEATMSTHDHTTDACINTAVNAATTFVSNM